MSVLPPAVDGFTMDSKILPVWSHYRTAALAQMDALRRATSFQVRWVVIPQEGTALVEAYGEIEFESRLNPGSWIWGYSLIAKVAGVNNPANVSFEVRDEGSGQKFQANYVQGNLWGLANRAADDRGKQPGVLSSPFCVTSPGRLASKLANNTGSQVSVQLVLTAAELCHREASPQECLP